MSLSSDMVRRNSLQKEKSRTVPAPTDGEAPPIPENDLHIPKVLPTIEAEEEENDEDIEGFPFMSGHERKYLSIMWRAFDHACRNGLRNPYSLGPGALQLAAAMLMSPNYDETELPETWTVFATVHPFLAFQYRRSVSGLLFRGNKLNPAIEEQYARNDFYIEVVVPDNDEAKRIVKQEFFQMDLGKPVNEHLQLRVQWPSQ